MQKTRSLIAVVGTEMQGIEQKRILSGIVSQAQQEKADTAVISNIFNPLEPELGDCCENRIFDLLLSADPAALIVLSESFVNPVLRSNIRSLLKQRQDIPILLVGAELPEFGFPCISTSDANDLAEITLHLIEEHGCRDIALLTGPLSEEVSRARVAGYRTALASHGIPFDEKKVYEGDFWYNSGEQLANAFLSGEKPMPEALVCANDYMAFGVLDAFECAGVNICDRMLLTGYEFIPERNLHTPLLTTYQRNRAELGRKAVQILMQKLRGETPDAFSPPHGRLIHGVTCACSVSRIRQHEELVTARLTKQYADWSLKSDMERMLTECRDMDSFSQAMGKFMFLMHGVRDILLCLFEDWHRPEPVSETLLCRSVNPWADQTIFRLKKTDLAGLTGRTGNPCAYFWLPVCFGERLFGYCVLRYDEPDSIDDTCRSWIKAVANGLEFLRLKSDVHYLLKCRVLSGAYDSMTGMFSREGLSNACNLMRNTNGSGGIAALLLRCVTDNGAVYSAEDAKPAVETLLAAAKGFQQFQGGLSGRVSEREFVLLMPSDRIEPEIMQTAAEAELLSVLPIDRFLCVSGMFSSELLPETLFRSLTEAADCAESRLAGCTARPYFTVFSEVRTAVYREPNNPRSLTQNAAALGFHRDYFNRKYKECFGLSFHQDCIRSRILYAVHLLMHTALTVSEAAEQCGYTESKYFIRQFSAVTGVPPKAFRMKAACLSESGN
ncbi:MAG: substrate-binding domain-containing protein [Oscillospiraceae bacterium]|nr:substrate-binding domain-containing protein [Oscillospiraceae bacterium]